MTKQKKIKITGNILISQAIDLLEAARHQAVKNTNSLMVFTYFHLGRLIIENEQTGNVKAVYGKETIKQLSKETGSLRGTWNK